MKGRSEAKGPPSADLLVCFPSRAHLTLMPKPICSPARPSESKNRRHHHHHKKPAARGAGQASPLLWAKTKPMDQEGSEPTSPKVTCAGQIKVRHKTNACKSWQSVMEEIEKIHNSRKSKRSPTTWLDSVGFKKDVMQFLTCLRNVHLDFRCFGAFPPSEITTDDEDDDDDDPEDYNNDVRGNHVKSDHVDNDESSRTVFSKWFMVLQENQNKIENSKGFAYNKEERKDKDDRRDIDDDDHGHDGDDDESDGAPVAPPPNALLLMRCRSAPAKTWLEEKEEEENKAKENEEMKVERKKSKKNLRSLMDEEKRNNENNKENNLVVMTYNTDFNKLSSDIAKETWIVGGMKDLLSRSRSWKR